MPQFLVGQPSSQKFSLELKSQVKSDQLYITDPFLKKTQVLAQAFFTLLLLWDVGGFQCLTSCDCSAINIKIKSQIIIFKKSKLNVIETFIECHWKSMSLKPLHSWNLTLTYFLLRQFNMKYNSSPPTPNMVDMDMVDIDMVGMDQGSGTGSMIRENYFCM